MIEISAILLFLLFIAWALCRIGNGPGPRVLEKPSSGAPPDPPKGQGRAPLDPSRIHLQTVRNPVADPSIWSTRVFPPLPKEDPSFSVDDYEVRKVRAMLPIRTILASYPRPIVDYESLFDWDNLESDLARGIIDREGVLRVLELAVFGPRPPQDPETRKEAQDAPR